MAKGEVGNGLSFIVGFENERQLGFTLGRSAVPCQGTSCEIGGLARVTGSRKQAARRHADGLMRLAGQGIGAKGNSLQVPANKGFKRDARTPSIESVRLLKCDFQKYRRAAERKRLIEGLEVAANSLPR